MASRPKLAANALLGSVGVTATTRRVRVPVVEPDQRAQERGGDPREGS